MARLLLPRSQGQEFRHAMALVSFHWNRLGTHIPTNGIDGKDEATKKKAIYRIIGDGKYWASSVDKEKGNFDYLMFADIDHNHPEVKADIEKWALWLIHDLKLSGIRFDAVKHFSEEFLLELITYITDNIKKDLFFVGTAHPPFWGSD
jgi:alpha-amylase